MQLVNRTPLAAQLDTSDIGGLHRIGLVTAKATYRFAPSGSVSLETQAPLPLFVNDEPVRGGILPADLEPRRDPVFEVILLGHAHAPNGKPIESLTVALSVGATRRELRISGDRRWVCDEGGAMTITRPEPFNRMALGFERAFGGRAVARIDESSELSLQHPLNPHGRGFDAELMATRLGDLLRAPPGFPVLVNDCRALPNVESPAALITRPEDSPEPAGWGTLPRDVPLHAARRARQLSPEPPEIQMAALTSPEDPLAQLDPLLYRAHPDWLLPIPPRAPHIQLEHLLDEHADVRFHLPDQRVVADYVLGDRTGSRPLLPQTLVLLPDERRFYLVYRLPFTYAHVPGEERAMRIRLVDGWYPGGQA